MVLELSSGNGSIKFTKYVNFKSFLLSNRGTCTLKLRINLKILVCKRPVVHEFVLFETQPNATMLNLKQNKYSENAKSCKALVIMYINKFILFTFS